MADRRHQNYTVNRADLRRNLLMASVAQRKGIRHDLATVIAVCHVMEAKMEEADASNSSLSLGQECGQLDALFRGILIRCGGIYLMQSQGIKTK